MPRFPFDAVYAINLRRRVDRWQSLTAGLHRCGLLGQPSLPFIRMEAVDGSDPEISAWASRSGLISPLGLQRLALPQADRIWGMDLNAGGIGCALSHWQVWLDVIAKRHRAALVLEDDSLIPPDLDVRVAQVWGRDVEPPPGWHVVYLSGLDTMGKGPLLPRPPWQRPPHGTADGLPNYHYAYCHQFHRTTNAYVLNASGAERLMSTCFPLTFQLDTAMTFHCKVDRGSGEPFVVDPVSYVVTPCPIVQATRFGSDIQDVSTRDVEGEERARCAAAQLPSLL